MKKADNLTYKAQSGVGVKKKAFQAALPYTVPIAFGFLFHGFANCQRFRNRVLYVLDKDSTYSLEPLDVREIHKAGQRE